MPMNVKENVLVIFIYKKTGPLSWPVIIGDDSWLQNVRQLAEPLVLSLLSTQGDIRLYLLYHNLMQLANPVYWRE